MSDALERKDELIALCRKTIRLAPAERPPDLPILESAGVPDWYPFERKGWANGETARQTLIGRRNWKRDQQLQQEMLAVATHEPLRRGRQSWLMALGFVDAQPLANRIAPFLTDPNVDGHVIDALLKMRSPDYVSEIWRLSKHEQPWIRKLARRYLVRYSDAA